MTSYLNSGHDVDEILRRNLEKIVETKVIMKPYQVEQNVLTMRDAVGCLIRAMRQVDNLFDAIFQRTVYTGSYYEGLRVKSANEFDLNFVISLPFNKDQIVIEAPDSKSPYITYQLKNRAVLSTVYKYDFYEKMLEFFDDEGFLVRSKVQSWFHSVIAKALADTCLKWPKTVRGKKLTWFQPGTSPAFTCQFTSARTGHQIDVDLSPVIDVCPFNTPSSMYQSPRFKQILNKTGRQYRRHRKKLRVWFLVPKALTKKGELSDGTLWRMAFPEAEKSLLVDTGCLRKMIKIFKLLRDCNEEWEKPISSYYIKTFFVHEFEANPSLDYWSDRNLGTLFMKMLEAFQGAIGDRNIPYYFNPEANLLYKLEPIVANNIYNRIKHIITLLKLDPDNVQKIFT